MSPFEVWQGAKVEAQALQLCLLRFGDVEFDSAGCTRILCRGSPGGIRANSLGLTLFPPFPVLPAPAVPCFFPNCSLSHRAGGRNRFQSPPGWVQCVRAQARAAEIAPSFPCTHRSVVSLGSPQVVSGVGASVHTTLGKMIFLVVGGAIDIKTRVGGTWELREGPGEGPTNRVTRVPRARPRRSVGKLRASWQCFRVSWQPV